MKYDPDSFTFGCEHEWADHSRLIKLPGGNVHDHKDHTVVNSTGIANDPTDQLYHFGGEINTVPTSTIEGQVTVLEDLLKTLPNAKVNYRSNLHTHIHIPGLKNDLTMLKQVQKYIHQHMPRLFPFVEPIKCPLVFDYKDRNEYLGAQKRFKRRLVSHHTLLSNRRLDHQLKAGSVEEFFKREVPHREDGSPCWHLQPRTCISLRQLLDTDTIEFRHFPGTVHSDELHSALKFCREFMVHALADRVMVIDKKDYRFPQFKPYQHNLEVRYRATVHDGSIDKNDIKANIKAILGGFFDESRYNHLAI